MASKDETKQSRRQRGEDQEQSTNYTDHTNPTTAPTASIGFPKAREVTIQGAKVVLPCKYFPGQTLDEDAALFASTMHHAAAMSAFGDRAKVLKDGKRQKDDPTVWEIEPHTPEQISAAALDYYNSYEWGPRGVAEVLDPTEREMRRIAKSEIETALRARGKTLHKVDKNQIEASIKGYLEVEEARIRAQAEDNLKRAVNLVPNALLDSLIPKEAPAAAAAEAA